MLLTPRQDINWVFLILILLYISEALSSFCKNPVSVKRRVPSEELFSRLFKRTVSLHEVESLNQCAKECFSDTTCSDVILCSKTCHKIGIFASSVVSKIPDTSSCTIYQMNRCMNGGRNQDFGFCNCRDEYTGRYCLEAQPENCRTQWHVIPHSENATTFKNAMESVLNPSCVDRHKVMMDNRVVVNAKTFGMDDEGYFWIQTQETLSKSSWDNYTFPPTREFTMIRHDGLVNVVRYTLGGYLHSKESTTASLKWYVEKNTNSPVFQTENGNVVQGSREALRNGLSKAYPVVVDKTIFSRSGRIIASMPDYLPDLGKSLFEFRWLDDYDNNILTNLNLGSNTVENSVVSSNPKSYWCLDNCWTKILETDNSGKEIFGSLSSLAVYVAGGHPVRVSFDDVTTNTKGVYTIGKMISAIVSVVEPTDYDQGNPNELRARRCIVSSDGTVSVRTVLLDTEEIIATSSHNSSVAWYVDSRRWNLVYSLQRNKPTVAGSLPRLNRLIKDGYSVRIGMENMNGFYITVQPDSFHLAPSGHVSADVPGDADVSCCEDKKVMFVDYDYDNWASIITTEGTFLILYFSRGVNSVVTEYVTDVSTLDWFVQY